MPYDFLQMMFIYEEIRYGRLRKGLDYMRCKEIEKNVNKTKTYLKWHNSAFRAAIYDW